MRTTACLAVLACVVTITVTGQVRYLTTDAGTWKPWKMTAIASARQERGASAAELKAFEAELVAFREILRTTGAVAEPRGFSVEVWGFLANYRPDTPSQPSGRALPLAGGVTFGAFPIFEYERAGKTIREDTGETALLLFGVNDIAADTVGRGRPPGWNELDTDAFLAPPRTGELAGWPRFDDLVVITRRTAPIWLPLTLDDAWQLQRRVAARRLANAREVLASREQELARELDPAAREARRAEQAALAPKMPDPQALLTQAADAERVRESMLRAELAPGGGAREAVDAAEAAVRAIDATVAGLSAGDRAAPACHDARASTPALAFRASAGPGCTPLVRPNWDVFDRSLPRTAPQVLLVLQVRRCYEDARPSSLPSGCTANRALLESLDRGAVLAWLR